MTRSTLANSALGLLVALCLSACASSETTPSLSRLHPIIADGLDIGAMNTVFVHGYGEIKSRAIDHMR